MSTRKQPVKDGKFTPVEDQKPKEETTEAQEKSWFAKGLDFGKKSVKFVGQKVTNGVHWVSQNTDWLVPTILVGVPTLLGGLSMISSGNNPSTWDPDMDEKLNLDHNLTNQELVQANKIMREEGISKAEALDEMGVLKTERKRK